MADVKTCAKCKVEKTLNNFSIINKGTDKQKPHSWCLECKRANSREFTRKRGHVYNERRKKLYKQNPEPFRKAMRDKYANDSETRDRVKRYNKKLAESGYRAAYMRKYRRESDVERIKGRSRSNSSNRLKHSKEKQGRCQRCNKRPVEHLHHHDYLLGDDVDYLCTRCHVDWHVNFELRLLFLETTMLTDVNVDTLKGFKDTGPWKWLDEKLYSSIKRLVTTVTEIDRLVYLKTHVYDSDVILSIVYKKRDTNMYFRASL